MLTREDHGKVAVLKLSHGGLNLLDTELLEAIALEFRELPAGYARSVVLTGHGRVFSAGLDLKRYLDGGADYARQLPGLLARAYEAVFRCPLPVVAAVNGHAIAGGYVLACCADARLMTDDESGQLGLTELKVGVPFPRSALEMVRHAVGDVVTRRLVFDAQTYGPKQAADLGLVDEVVPAGQLLEQAVAKARQLAEQSPRDTFTVTKAQLHRDAIDRIERYRDDEDRLAQRLWVEHAVVDGWVARYLESTRGKDSATASAS